MVPLSVVVCLSVLALAAATNVSQCPGMNIENLRENVQLSCPKIPCRLKKGTDQHITINFVAEKDMKEVLNRVSAELLGLPVPFIGVDGNSVCDKIFTPTGEKTSCPLKAGTSYVYKDSFPVLTAYPSLNVRVHWALQHNGEDIVCFEIPATIK